MNWTFDRSPGWDHLIEVYNRARGAVAGLALLSSLTVGFINGWPRGPLVPAACLVAAIHARHVHRSDRAPVRQVLVFDGTVLAVTTALIGIPMVAIMSAAFLLVATTVLASGKSAIWLSVYAVAGQALALTSSRLFFTPYTESQAALAGNVGVAFFAVSSVGLIRSLVRALRSAEEARQQAEIELRRRERRFGAMVEHISDGITLAAEDGTVLYTGSQNRRLTGFDDREGRRMDELVIGEDREIFRAAVSRLMGAPGQVERFAVRIRHANGGVRVMDVVATNRLHDPDLSAIVANFRDITAETRAKEALVEANERLEGLVRSKDEFVASVSHELRTPLTAVVGMAELLSDPSDRFGEEEMKEFRTTLLMQARETAAIVEDLLVAARADIGQVTIVTERCDIRAAVDGVLAAHPKGSSVEVDVPSGLVAHADPTRLRQIIRNLMLNAHRHGGGSVEISASQAGRAVVVTVSDNGEGVAPEDEGRIFEAYERSAGSPTQPASIGLGLTVSRALARMMGGDLHYRRDPGWSRFELVLPAAAVDSLAS